MKRAALMLRFVRRELRSTEARILVLALALAVASVGAVAMFADRVQSAFVEQANVLLGADAMISGDRPLPPAFAEAARAFGLTTTESTRFGSMVSVPVRDGGEVRSVLADVKAVAGDPDQSCRLPVQPCGLVRAGKNACAGSNTRLDLLDFQGFRGTSRTRRWQHGPEGEVTLRVPRDAERDIYACCSRISSNSRSNSFCRAVRLTGVSTCTWQ